MVLRVQGSEDKLAHYITAIREASCLFRVPMTEAELEIILVRLSPGDRTHLALLKRPTSFRELEEACVHSASIWYIEKTRTHEVMVMYTPLWVILT